MAKAKPSALVLGERRVIHCGDNLDQLRDNSPALQGWVIRGKMPKVPSGTKERFCRPSGTFFIWAHRFPALKRWAIFKATTR